MIRSVVIHLTICNHVQLESNAYSRVDRWKDINIHCLNKTNIFCTKYEGN